MTSSASKETGPPLRPLWGKDWRKLTAAGAGGLLVILLVIWGIVRDKAGPKVDRVRLLEGGSVTQESNRISNAPPPAIAPFDAAQAKKHQKNWAQHLGVDVEIENAIGMRFVLIPPGEFDMGSTEGEVAKLLEEARARNLGAWHIDRLPIEAPKHRVRITRPFYLGTSEVTQAEYERVIGSNPSEFQGDPARPVEMVDWDEAAAFCRKLGELPAEQANGAEYRLPTEAEWEYACRAGTTTQYSFGDDAGILGHFAWWSENSAGSTQPVGQLRANAFGLFDMHGNVWEWCADWHAGDYYTKSPAEDPRGPDSGSSRVLRGGSWNGDNPDLFRCVYRNDDGPGERRSRWGFRVARTLMP